MAVLNVFHNFHKKEFIFCLWKTLIFELIILHFTDDRLLIKTIGSRLFIVYSASIILQNIMCTQYCLLEDQNNSTAAAPRYKGFQTEKKASYSCVKT